MSTRIYGAPEVLGLDSNSGTSAYTNSVDIWSLGCVIYELLARTRYSPQRGKYLVTIIGHLLFEDILKGLSPPIDDAVISLLKSMLATQLQDRPTAEDALGNAWSVGLRSDHEDSGNDQGESVQSGDESSWSGENEGKLTTHRKRKKRRSQRNPTTQNYLQCAPGDVALGANPKSQWGSDPTTPKSEISTAMMIPPAVASVESSLIQKGSMNSGLTVDASQLPGDSFHGPQGAEETKDPRFSTSISLK